MKPHPSIFETALAQAGVAGAESVMVGDSLVHDIDGARRLGMRAVLAHRRRAVACPDDVPVISTLTDCCRSDHRDAECRRFGTPDPVPEEFQIPISDGDS